MRLVAVAAFANGFRREACAGTIHARAGVGLCGVVAALQATANAVEDEAREVHLTFFSFVCFGSPFLSRKMTCDATISVFQRFWPVALSSHSEVRSEPSMRT